jgi:hypothetical protein
MINFSEDRKECLADGEDVREISRLVRDINYMKGYITSLITNNSLDDNSLNTLYYMNENFLTKIEEYKKVPENLKIIADSELLRLENVCKILISNKKATEKAEEAKILLSS